MTIPFVIIQIVFFNNEYSNENDNGVLGAQKWLDSYFFAVLAMVTIFNIMKILTYSS